MVDGGNRVFTKRGVGAEESRRERGGACRRPPAFDGIQKESWVRKRQHNRGKENLRAPALTELRPTAVGTANGRSGGCCDSWLWARPFSSQCCVCCRDNLHGASNTPPPGLHKQQRTRSSNEKTILDLPPATRFLSRKYVQFWPTCPSIAVASPPPCSHPASRTCGRAGSETLPRRRASSTSCLVRRGESSERIRGGELQSRKQTEACSK